jgi:hypothetical protein
MIVSDGKYYLYRHIRCDRNDVFYIGYGTKKSRKPNCFIDSYSRAFDKKLRSLAWKSIVAKTEYKIEILLETNDKSFIHKKEKEFIALYGRKDLKKGNLVNFSDGGDGNQGYKLSDAHKLLISKQHTGVKFSEETKRKISEKLKGKKKSFEHIENLKKNFYRIPDHQKHRKPVLQYDLNGIFIKEWTGAKFAAIELNYKSPSLITAACKGKKPSAYSFKWSYKNQKE